MVALRAWRDSFTSGSFSNSPNDRAIHVRLHSVAIPIGASSKPQDRASGMLVVALSGRPRALRAAVLEVAGPVTEDPAYEGKHRHRREEHLLHRPQFHPTCDLVCKHRKLQRVPGDRPDGLPV